MSRGLAEELEAWSDEVDAIVPEDDPGSADFPSAQAGAAFSDRGLMLAQRAAAELSCRYEVTDAAPTSRPQVLVSSGAPSATALGRVDPDAETDVPS